MKIDLSICRVIPEYYISLILIVEYLAVFTLLCTKLCSLLANKQDSFEIYYYLSFSMLTCVLRLVGLMYTILFSDISIPFQVFTIFASVPSLSGASILSATWVKMYLQMCSYSEVRIKALDLYRKITYLLFNISLFITSSIFISFVIQKTIECDIYLFIQLCFDFVISSSLLFIGTRILCKFKEIMNTIPLRLLFWTICVLFICFLRVASLMAQSLPGFEGIVESHSLYSSIYVVGMLNLFEVIPIIMFLRAIVLVGNYLKKGNKGQCLESSSISELMQAMASDIVWVEY